MEIMLRQERVEDYEEIEQVVKEAFKCAPMRSGNEHVVIDQTRKGATFNEKYALVATEQENIVGYVMLSQAHVVHQDKKLPILHLGPVAVTPTKQRKGIGTKLIKHVLSIAKHEGNKAVIVLGHPTYYPRFGFTRASLAGLTLPFQAPDEAFLAMELKPASLQKVSGIVEFPASFFGE